ncbi:MAG: hypothetical protein PUP93_28040 [Rhizonema sp. NSF051]|nr:hypothetical protein [Rhizonema sp. NSF051]
MNSKLILLSICFLTVVPVRSKPERDRRLLDLPRKHWGASAVVFVAPTTGERVSRQTRASGLGLS